MPLYKPALNSLGINLRCLAPICMWQSFCGRLRVRRERCYLPLFGGGRAVWHRPEKIEKINRYLFAAPAAHLPFLP